MRTEEGLLLLTEDGAIHWANQSAADLLGYSREELQEKALPLLQKAPRNTRTSLGPIALAFARILRGELTEAEGDARFPAKGDRRIAVHWKLWILPGAAGVRQILLSICETAPASEQVASLSGYRDIFEHAIEGIFRTTLEGQYLEVNPALAHMYGFEGPAELIEARRDISSELYVEPQRRAEFVQLMHRQGYVSDFESEVYRADGSTMWISEFARVVHDARGTALYYEGTVIDITERKQTEDALKRSEEKYRRLVEMTNVVPWEADAATGTFTYVGPQAEKYLRYPLAEWLEPGFWERTVHPEDRIWVEIVRSEAIDKRQSIECEYRMVRADNQVIWTREFVSVLPDESEPAKIGGFMMDVSYRKEAEESLRESQHFIERIASASPTIVYVYDPNERQSFYVNGRVPDILGYSREALSEMQPFFLSSLAHPDEFEAHEAYFASLSDPLGPQVRERDFRLRSSCGQWIWLRSRECVFNRDASGHPVRIVGTIEDITLYRHTMEELNTNELLFRGLAETTRLVPFSFDPRSQRFTYIGPQVEKLFGYSVQRWYKVSGWMEFLHPDDASEGTRFATECTVRAPQDFQTEFRILAADGREVWLRQIVHCGTEDDDRVHVRGFLLDVTENKLMEEERERSQAELRELAARIHDARENERTSIAREIHDELGQSLMLFKLDLSWISTRLLKLDGSEAVQPILSKVGDMDRRLTGTLQTIRRVLTALRPPLLDEFGLAEALEWHAKEFARCADLVCDLHIDPVEGLGSEQSTAMFRIFQELTTNVARHARASRISVSLNVEKARAVLTVSDNGCGLSEDIRAKRGHYGLVGIRERARVFGGCISIRSEAGQGTTVRVDLPLVAAATGNGCEAMG